MRRFFHRVLLFVTFCLFILILAAWLLTIGPNRLLVSVESPPRLYEIQSRDGRLTVSITRGWPGMSMLGFSHYPDMSATRNVRSFLGLNFFEAPAQLAQMYSPTAQDLGLITGGSAWMMPARPSPLQTLVITIPWWQPALLLGLYPAASLCVFSVRRYRYWVRERRRKNGLCPACGYDLRGSTDRCPECGMAIGQRVTQ
jgi:hypothetical protein